MIQQPCMTQQFSAVVVALYNSERRQAMMTGIQT
jgi:hypothetical protein